MHLVQNIQEIHNLFFKQKVLSLLPIMSHTGFYQRDYNIINFAPTLLNNNARAVSEPTLPKIAPSSTKSFNKNFSTIRLTDEISTKNTYPFENIVNEVRQKKKYDPLLQSKIITGTKYDNCSNPTLFNASGIRYDFIAFTAQKDRNTIHNIKNNIPASSYKKSAISEFAHLGRVTSPNFNNNFKSVLSQDVNAFRIKNGMGSQHLDGLRTYGGIAECFKRSGK